MTDFHIIDELTQMFQDIIDGKEQLYYVDSSWDDVFAGDVEFETSNGWSVTVFYDCDGPDYVSSCVTPAGDGFGFDYLWERGCPFTPLDYEKLELVLKSAGPKVICL